MTGPIDGSAGPSLEQAEALANCLKLLDALEELDDVRSVTSNLEADEALMQAALS